MSGETESEYTENESSAVFNEDTYANLTVLRALALENMREYLERGMDSEVRNYTKYSVLANAREPFMFKDEDSEDLGVSEDLAMLDITTTTK